MDKANAVKAILSDLKKGVAKSVILSKYAQKCQKDKRTVERWFKESEIKYNDFMSKANPIIEAKEIEALGEIAKAGIMSKYERMLLLSEIANGSKRIWKQVSTANGIETLESYDPVKYIAELNKMDGAYLEEMKEANNEPIIFKIINSDDRNT